MMNEIINSKSKSVFYLNKQKITFGRENTKKEEGN